MAAGWSNKFALDSMKKFRKEAEAKYLKDFADYQAGKISYEVMLKKENDYNQFLADTGAEEVRQTAEYERKKKAGFGGQLGSLAKGAVGIVSTVAGIIPGISGAGKAASAATTAAQTTSQMGSITDALSSAKQAFNGINFAQAQVVPSGQVNVPPAQSGTGIFSKIITVGSQALNAYKQLNPTVKTTVAAGVGNTTPLVSTGGGVVITGSVKVGDPVTTNTTEAKANGTKSSTGGVLGVIIGIAIAFWLFTEVLKPKSRRRR